MRRASACGRMTRAKIPDSVSSMACASDDASRAARFLDQKDPFRFGISVIGYLIVAPNRQQFHVAVVHDAEFGLERIDDSLQIARIVDAQAQILSLIHI